MPYKDKDKQREAVRLATRRYRNKGITPKVSQVSHNEGITEQTDMVSQESMVIPKDTAFTMPVDVRQNNITDNEPIIKTQSYNPMMVGYVPPKD